MCLWLITACLGMLPTHPSPTVIVVPSGVPSPILVPTTAATTTTTATTARPATPATGAPTMPPTMAPSTTPPTAAPTPASTASPTAAPTPAPTTAAPMPAPTTAAPTPAPTTAAPTSAPTMAPSTATTAAPTAAPATALPSTTGGTLLSLLICTAPDAICVANPDDDTGPIAIDPRLGSSPPPSAALQVPPISAYNAQVDPYDSAVKFPRDKRSADSERSVKDVMMNFMTKHRHEIRKRQTNCRCVPAGTCATNGGGLIDVRIVTPGATQCPAGQVYCCGATTTVACGKVQAVPAGATAAGAGQASFGEFPWQAMVLTKQNDYLAGGVLIDQLNVLTVTHRLVNYVVAGTGPNLKVRLGEWDAAVTTEPVAFQEFNVAKVFTHPSYNQITLQFDLTVLRLATPVPLSPAAGAAVTINRACLPASATTTFTGQSCWVAGWGKNQFGLQGQYQQIIKKVDVPIVAPATCQTQLQTARLGASYVLDTTSFVCAGGEASKDSCTGDGGSGLVCNMTGSWVVVGLVSWGLGCANANVPGVYVNIAGLLPWIQQQVATA